MRVIRKIAVGIVITLTLFVGCLSVVFPASAHPAQTTQAHTVAIPLSDPSFNVSAVGVVVTGTIHFTGSKSFQLKNVILYDTKCDHSSAYFQAADQQSEYAVHQNGKGCNSSLPLGTLSGSANYSIDYIYITVWTNNSLNWSNNYDNPY